MDYIAQNTKSEFGTHIYWGNIADFARDLDMRTKQ